MKSLWQQKTPLPSFEALREDIIADVLVIGGGLAGLLTACMLTEKGADCVIAEKGQICCETTAHTTAKITAQQGLIYHRIIRNYGKDYAKAYYKANADAVRDLINLCNKTGCKVEIKDNYIYSQNEYELHKELEALNQIGISVLFKKDIPLPIMTAGAIGFSNQAQFNPLELIKHLSKNLKIFENTRVTQMIGTTAVTEKGKINAKKVVVATHFPFINKHGSYFLKLYQHRSYILALDNTPKLSDMYVDNNKKGMSFSSFDNLLLLGGGGHRTGKKGGSYKELINFKEMHYPRSREVLRWAAQDTISLDKIPYIGQYSKNTPNLYVITGFNKWGMANSMLAARIISEEIAGTEMEYAEIFSPSRSILRPQLISNGLESIKNLLTPTTRRCPHLGCALKYNKAEHSWDCPCHGSRFEAHGKVLDGPANKDISPAHPQNV